MTTLVVFDSFAKIEKNIASSLNINDVVYLFPLTSKKSITTILIDKIKSFGCKTEMVQSVKMINFSADNLRDRYIRFIAELPLRFQHRGKNLKEFFSIDEHASLWWFSLISQKNTFKSDAFNRLAQLDAILEVIRYKKIEKIIFGCRSNKLKEALLNFASEKSIRFIVLPVRQAGGMRDRVREIERIFFLMHILLLFYLAIRYFFRSLKIRRKFHKLHRKPFDNTYPMLITPYPSMDIPLAKRGIFKNKFYLDLQSALESNKGDIIWIAMYDQNNSIPFYEALTYAEMFIKNGYIIFFLEEFNSIGIQIKAFMFMLKNSLKFLTIEKKLSKLHTFGDYNFYPIFRNDWCASFVGTAGYTGLLYYDMFKSLLKRVKVQRCLYLCEMHAWERALIFARNVLKSKIFLAGYQPGTVSRFLLNYFNDPAEIKENGPFTMPRPDKIICNGQLPFNYILESGWPKEMLSIAEAIRYRHLNKYMITDTRPNKKKEIILLAFSIDPNESSSILNLAYESFNNMKGIEVVIKSHPFLKIEDVFNLSGIMPEKCSFKIKEGPIECLLDEARIVIVGESGVSIEALAFGCEVIIVNMPEWINMSPLRNIKASMIRTANTPEELRQIVFDIFKEKYNPELHKAEAVKIIKDFFCFNEKSDSAEKFLNILMTSRI